jgi:2-succinyl-6-hydroxy-2,4-cyclohexadiene-1-carboxylate synthase
VSAMTVTPSIRWAVRDEGAGPPVLLLHGFTGTSDAWDSHGTDLVARHRILIPCLPGHGGTSAPPEAMSVEATADALAVLLAARNAVPAHVVGYSLGARVGLRLAVAHPDVIDRLVLESPSAGLASDAERAARRAADEALAARLEADGIERFVDEWERNPVFAGAGTPDPDRAARVREMRLGNDPAGLAASLRHAGQGAMAPLFDALATIATPTLVIAGELDAIGRPRAERVAAAIPDARLAVVGGAGHTPHDERPEAFRRLVSAFLEEEPTR